MRDFSGKVVFVTGGSRGIGRAVCQAFAAAGADVALLYRSRAEQARETCAAIEASGRRALAFQVDVAQAEPVREAVEETLRQWGRLDVMVHAAGAQGVWQPVRQLSPEAWRDYVAVDLNGAFNVVHAALQVMHERQTGVIVAVSSIATQMCQARNSQGAAAKAGVEALIRVVAREEGRSGIRANAVAVGLTDTDMAREALERWGAETAERIVAGIPAGRIGTPEEVANLITFLASEEGAYITGKVLQIDGGQFIGG
ncbi:MAG TPA: SDR family NAD(P)-dependent oxidoreductase [bacterium]|nr:SDR family NAD(P)-dependent oxidoreductase [bacterium]